MYKYRFYKILRMFHLISKRKYKKKTACYQFMKTEEYKAVAKSKLFDKQWYLSKNPDVKKSGIDPIEHYLKFGWKEARECTPYFDGNEYLRMYPDVAKANVNPLVHWELYGKKEGRFIINRGSVNIIERIKNNYVKVREELIARFSWKEFSHKIADKYSKKNKGKSQDYKLIAKSKYFNKRWYLKQYPDVKKAGVDPVEHYMKYGWKEGRNPGPEFDGRYYYLAHKDVAKVGINPLNHYEKHKIDEKRICNVCTSVPRNCLQIIKSFFYNKKPKISIIVASYNYEKYIRTTLDSLLNQTYKNFEIIVVDDGSKDNSVDLIKKYVKKYDNIKLYRHKNGTNQGLPSTLELGISKCVGDYIAFCEADDYWTYDHLEEYVKIINKYARPEIITNDCECFGNDELLVNKKQRYIVDRNHWMFQKNKRKFSFAEFRENNYITTFSAVMIKSSALRMCNFLTPRKAVIDWWLWRQLAFRFPIYFINKRITKWRIHESYLEKSNLEKKLYQQCFISRMDNILKNSNFFNNVPVNEYDLIKNSNHFDEVYYRNMYDKQNVIKDCIRHYYSYGWRKGYNPSVNFSTNDYLELNPEIISEDICPLVHYEAIGRKKWNRYKKEKIVDENKVKQYWNERKKYPNRDKVQYSCMTGGYDDFVISDYFNPEYDYILFTDSEKLLRQKYFGVWKCVPLKYTDSDNVRISRWHKTHPHELLAKYKYSLWCDSNQNFVTDYVYRLIAQHIVKGVKFAAFKHYCRDCLYDEAIECKKQRKDNPDIIDNQIFKYRKEGFPANFGLFETGLLFRTHHNEDVKKVNEEWFDEIYNFSRRDQLSFTYSLWKNDIICTPFAEKNLREINRDVELFKHIVSNNITSNQEKITMINYRSYEDLKHDILKNIYRLNFSVDLIVAVPRSGVIPAYMLGAFLHKPVKTLDEFVHNISTTKSDRMKHDRESYKHILVIDDSVNEGVALQRTKDKIGKLHQYYNIQYAAIYATDRSQCLVDFHFSICPQPRVFEWNYLNSGYSKYMGFDIDGVLCVDPTDEENDDGEKYINFLLNAKPLYIPKYEIGALITSRLEKYRIQTETWCKQNQVKYKQLYMLDLPSKSERIKQQAHTRTKIEVYQKRDDLVLFIESSARQAEIIARETHKDVICVENGKLYTNKRI